MIAAPTRIRWSKRFRIHSSRLGVDADDGNIWANARAGERTAPTRRWIGERRVERAPAGRGIDRHDIAGAIVSETEDPALIERDAKELGEAGHAHDLRDLSGGGVDLDQQIVGLRAGVRRVGE